MTLREEKSALRTQYLKIRSSLTQEQNQEISHAICERFLTLASYRYSENLLLYAPLGGEIDVMPIARSALLAKKSVWFPLCNLKDCTVSFHRVTDPENQLDIGAYHIREPKECLPVYDCALPCSLCIVPAIVYDRRGYRLGYGKGYYDRFLPNFHGTIVGVAASSFLLNEIPHGHFDRTVDILLTEKGVTLLHAH